MRTDHAVPIGQWKRLPLSVYRYLLSEVFTPFAGGFIFFMLLFLMFQALHLADYFINHGASLLLLAKVMFYASTAFFPVVLPIAFLFATLVTFGRMSADSEIVALKACGMSMVQLYLPVALISVGISSLILYLTFSVIPWGNYEFRKTILKLGNTKVVSNLREGTFTEGFFDLLVYAEKVDVSQNKMSGVFIYDERDPKNPNVVVAKEGAIIPLKTEGDIGAAAVLHLRQGAIHRSDLSSNLYEKLDFNEYRILLKVEEGASGDMRYPKTISSSELARQMAEPTIEHGRWLEYAIEISERIALSLTPLIFGILGIGLGVVRSRNVKSNAVVMAVGTIIVYWGLYVLGTSLAEKGLLTPFVAIQLPNIAVLPFAILSFRRSMW